MASNLNSRHRKLCIHVTNLSGTTSGEILANLFETTVAYVVFGFDKNQAWIKNYQEEATAKRIAEKFDKFGIDDQKISCHHVAEINRPADLCRYAMHGRCVRNDSCYYKHIPCSNPYNCQDDECYLQHYSAKKQRLIPAHLLNVAPQYCIRIEGLPAKTTVENLVSILTMGEKHFGKDYCFHIPSLQLNGPKYAYLHNIHSEIYARKFVNKWHNNALFQGNGKLKCQIEYEQGHVCITTALTRNAIKLDENLLPVKKDKSSPSVYKTDTSGEPDSPTENEKDDIASAIIAQHTGDVSPKKANSSDSESRQTLTEFVPPSTKLPSYETSVGQQEDSKPNSSKHVDGSKDDDYKGRRYPPPSLQRETDKKWKFSGDIFGSGDSGQAVVYKAKRILPPYEPAALKSFEKKFPKEGPSRSYREFIAMDRLKDVPHVPQWIETNIPKNQCGVIDETRNHRVFWIIMTVAPGVSLQTLAPPYPLLESISFSINLLSIVKSFHAKGIVHRDLKPENIQIDWTDDAKSLANAHITVLDFGLAYIENRTRDELIPTDDIDFEKVQKEEQEEKLQVTAPGVPLGNRWYRVPQLRSQGSASLSSVAKEKLVQARRSSTIDASSVCAILFWLLTGVVPEEDDDTTKRTEKKVSPGKNESSLLYHQQEEKMLIDIVKNTVQETNRDMHNCDINRLTKYLLHTFDRGLADVDEQWLEDQWSVDQLLNHLNYMQFRLLSSPPPLSLRSSPTITFIDDFTTPISLFVKAKHYFLEKAPRCHWQGDPKNYHWTKGWNERKHTDLLTHSQNGETWTILVTCSAKLVKIQKKQVMRLFVGTTVNSVDLQLPIDSYDMTETIGKNKAMKFNYLFKQELHDLISIFHGRQIYLIEEMETKTVSSQTD